MQSLCLPLQLRKGGHPPKCVAGAERLPIMRKSKMRIVETGAAGVIALATQFLMVAAVLI